MAKGMLSMKKAPDHAPAREKSHRDHVEAVAKSLVAQRKDEEADWYQIADYSGYGELPLLRKGANGKERPKMRQLSDSHPIRSFRTVQSGMYSGLSSPNRPWFDFKFADVELERYQAAREWKDKFQALIYAMFDASNFYQVARQNYGSMARFGPAAGIMTEHPLEIAPCLGLGIGSYWFGFNDAFKVDTLLRDVPLTVQQVVQMFVGRPGGQYDWSVVAPKVKDLWDRSQYTSIVQCRQLIEPDATGFKSTIWDTNDDRKGVLLECKSYADQPFWGPRWDTRDGGPTNYGRGVGHDVLGDLRELAMQVKRKREITDHLAKPATYGMAKDIDMRPGAHTYVADMSNDYGAKPVYTPNPAALTQVREDIRDIKQAIDEGCYADLFMAITNMPGVQPRNVEEILKRDEEKLTQLGPVVEMVNDDMLPIAIERMIGIAKRGGLIPPAPEELQGQELKVEFVSVLAMAQKMLGLTTTERVVGFVGSLGQVFGPEALDKIDPDAIIDDYAERANLPAAALRDKAAVDKIRGERAQAAEMAQMAEMAAPAQAATQAAANIAEMSDSGLPI